MVVQPAHVAAQLALDLVGRGLERDPRLAGPARGLEDDALGDWSNDVAGEILVRPLAEGDVGGNRPVEIFIGDRFNSLADPLLQNFAGFDLMARDSHLHHGAPFLIEAGGALAAVRTAT